MDLHSFRQIGAELVQLLSGARIEKIYGPVPYVYIFTVFAQGKKRHLIYNFSKQASAFFFSDAVLPNPLQPKSDVMRLRKYLAGRRLGNGMSDFISRRLIFPVLVHESEPPLYVVMTMREGIQLVSELPSDNEYQVEWPPSEVIEAIADQPWDKKAGYDIWQQYPVLTPALRETLAGLDVLDAKALLIDLEAGGGDSFLYTDSDGKPVFSAAWPLAESVIKRRSLHEIGNVREYVESHFPAFADLYAVYPHLAVYSLVAKEHFFAIHGQLAEKKEETALNKSMRKLKKLRDKLNQEEQRLLRLVGLRKEAKLLQHNLWRLESLAKMSAVSCFEVNDSGDEVEHTVELDPRYTIRDNMQRMFHQATRGDRGLVFLKEQMQRLSEQEQALASNAAGNSAVSVPETSSVFVPTEKKRSSADKHIARFKSSDGFTIFRGKSSQGNQRVVKQAQPHDLWLHSKDGPSAHVIIRRLHAAQDVPEQTLREAAILAALKGWQQHDAYADIMIAYVRHVRGIKGGVSGAVQIDKLVQTIRVPVDPSLESLLFVG